MIKLVLLSGFDGSGRLFTPLLDKLSPTIEPLVLAYPNHAPLSYQEIYTYLLPRLPNEPLYILGESFGGPLAILIANYAKDYVKGLILCVTFASNPRPHLSKLFRPITHPIFFRNEMPAWYIKKALLGGANNQALIEQVKLANATLSAEIIHKRLEEIININVLDTLAELELPILYQRALDDWLVKKYSLTQIETKAKNLSISQFNAPHLLLQTQPNETSKDIERFISSTR